jgi:hypothetical protein
MLPFVLLLVLCVGLVGGAAVTYAGTTLTASASTYLPARAKSADADSAIRTAVEYVRSVLANGGTLSCPTDFSYPGTTGTVTVRMCPQTSSENHVSYLDTTLLTLAPSGQGITQTKNNTLLVSGDVWSNSYISVRDLDVENGKVWAWNDTAGGGNCSTAKVTASGGKDCNAHATFNDVVPPEGTDPGDPALGHSADWQPAAAPGPVQTPTGCNLQPGVYVSGSALTNACNSTITLAAGVYYLNFPSTDSTWTINGTLQGPACVNDNDPGAQLVLANHAQISNGGTIAIPCGARTSSTAPRIAIMGLKSTVGAGTDQTTVLRPATAADAGGGYFPSTGTHAASNAAHAGNGAYPQDNTVTRASIAQNNRTAKLQFNTFSVSSGPALLANAAITSLVVKVVHNESNTNLNFGATPATLTWGGCAIALTPTPSHAATATTYVSNDLSAGLSGCVFDASSSPALTWNVKTTSGSAVNIDVDGAQIEATWHDPGIAAQAGCTLHGGCDVIRSASPNGHDSFLVNDIVYIPQSSFQTTCKNNCNFNIGLALIAWSLRLDANPASVGEPLIGAGTTTTGCEFLATIGTTPWTDAFATYDTTTHTPRITKWIRRT